MLSPKRAAIDTMTGASTPDPNAIVDGVLAGDRAVLARAITLVESHRPDHRRLAAEVLDALLPHAGRSQRIGISGVPGVGKSTLINALGTTLCERGARLAVLAVDPSSQRTGGSILGDKTRMDTLTAHPNAFIRPSPAGRQLGGVASATADTIALVEAAGFDTVLVETVGVGQSETLVSEMTDCFVLMLLPGAGDELQGIKKGIVELADIVAVNKADGETEIAASHAARDVERALHTLRQRDPHWQVPVTTCSAQTGAGLPALWQQVDDFFGNQRVDGRLEAKRRQQQLSWLWHQVDTALRARARRAGAAVIEETENAVANGDLSPRQGAERLLAALLSG